MRYIVLVAGYSCSGKDLLCDYIVSKCSNFVKLSFAGELKKYVAETHKFDYNLTLTQEGKKTLINNTTVRNLLIYHATQERLKNNNIWAIKLAEKINFMDKLKNLREANDPLDNIIISDFRFPNEIDYIRNNFNGKIITVKINRSDESPVHSNTEYQLDNFKFDYTIDNKSDINNFYKQIMNTLYFLFD
jgi:dephospho-CoA kinase